jgi:hypothetical protein
VSLYFIAPQYITDLGTLVPYVKMDIAFIGEDLRSLRRVSDLSSISTIIPASLTSLLRQMNLSCEVDIFPRFAILNLQGDRRLKLSYPFQPGSADWQIFWNDLLANPQIISTQGIGETLTNSFLKRL